MPHGFFWDTSTHNNNKDKNNNKNKDNNNTVETTCARIPFQQGMNHLRGLC